MTRTPWCLFLIIRFSWLTQVYWHLTSLDLKIYQNEKETDFSKTTCADQDMDMIRNPIVNGVHQVA